MDVTQFGNSFDALGRCMGNGVLNNGVLGFCNQIRNRIVQFALYGNEDSTLQCSIFRK